MKRAVFAALALALIATGCNKKSTNPPPPNSVSVTIQSASAGYSPSTVTITAGTTVRWTNTDSAPHTVTSVSGGELGSTSLSNGGVYDHTFSTPGTFEYHCTIHSSMPHGMVVVQ
jgi:plastocyanin